MGNFDAAVADLDQAIELDPDNTDVYYNRGKTKTSLNDAEGAIGDYIKAISFNQNLAEAYGNRDVLYFKLVIRHLHFQTCSEQLNSFKPKVT